MVKDMKDGSEYWEDRLVEQHIGHFTNKFELDEDISVSITDGDLVSFLVTARADGAAYTSIKDSINKKKDRKFIPQSVTPLDSDRAKHLYDAIGEKVHGVNDGLVEVKVTTVDDDAPVADADEYPVDEDSSDQTFNLFDTTISSTTDQTIDQFVNRTPEDEPRTYDDLSPAEDDDNREPF